MLKRFLWLLVLSLLTVGAAQSARESTLVIGVDLGDLITLDPQVSYEFSGSLIADNLYETLVRFEGTDLSEVRPALAESWTGRRLRREQSGHGRRRGLLVRPRDYHRRAVVFSAHRCGEDAGRLDGRARPQNGAAHPARRRQSGYRQPEPRV